MLLILGALLIVGWIARVTEAKWFPYPSSWLKAFTLAIPTWFGMVAYLSIEFWHFTFLSILVVKTDAPLEAVTFLSLLSAVFLVASLVWYRLLILLYSLSLSLFWTEVPQFLRWIKPPTRKRDILFDWAASTLAVIVIAIPLLLFAFYSDDLIMETTQSSDLLIEEVVQKMIGGWYVVTAYLYHLKDLLRSMRLK